MSSVEGKLAVAQLCGAAAVALLVSVRVLVLPRSAELDTARVLLAGFISLAGYRVAIGGGSPRGCALLYAGAVLMIAVVIATVENILAVDRPRWAGPERADRVVVEQVVSMLSIRHLPSSAPVGRDHANGDPVASTPT